MQEKNPMGCIFGALAIISAIIGIIILVKVLLI